MYTVDLACRAALGIVFLVAVRSKLHSRAAFAEFGHALVGLDVPTRVAGLRVAVLVIAAELLVVLLPWLAPRLGYALAVLLLTGFLAVFGRSLRRARPVACRCFGASERPIGISDMARNVCLIALAALGAACQAANTTEPMLAGVLASLLAGAFVGALFTRWDDLAYLLFSSAPSGPPFGLDGPTSAEKRP